MLHGRISYLRIHPHRLPQQMDLILSTGYHLILWLFVGICEHFITCKKNMEIMHMAIFKHGTTYNYKVTFSINYSTLVKSLVQKENKKIKIACMNVQGCNDPAKRECIWRMFEERGLDHRQKIR